MATKRNPWGHVSRHCIYCGKVGPRVSVVSYRGQWAHRYCLNALQPKNRPQEAGASTKGDGWVPVEEVTAEEWARSGLALKKETTQ